MNHRQIELKQELLRKDLSKKKEEIEKALQVLDEQKLSIPVNLRMHGFTIRCSRKSHRGKKSVAFYGYRSMPTEKNIYLGARFRPGDFREKIENFINNDL